MLKPFSLHKDSSAWGRKILQIVQGYNHQKYWKRRAVVVDPDDATPTALKLWYLFYIKRTDARHGCSFGTNFHAGAQFETPPLLPHGPSGIIIGHDIVVGANVTIFQQVTIAHGGGVEVGPNVMLGAGSKILQGRIGALAKIGANCVVVGDVPAHATAVLPRPRILLNGNDTDGSVARIAERQTENSKQRESRDNPQSSS